MVGATVYPALKVKYDPLAWHVAGDGKAHSNCGEVLFWVACKNCKSNYPIKRSCDRMSCPVCYEVWAKKEADKASNRISQILHLNGIPESFLRHFILSPPQDMAINMLNEGVDGYKKLKKWLNDILKVQEWYYESTCCGKVKIYEDDRDLFGMSGYAIVFHPYRKTGDLSPHFHVMGIGYMLNSRVFEYLTKWSYRNKGKREDLSGSLRYELDHCGYIEAVKGHSIVYYGLFSYNKTKVKLIKEMVEIVVCSVCESDLYVYECDDPYCIDWSVGSNKKYSVRRKVKVYSLDDG